MKSGSERCFPEQNKDEKLYASGRRFARQLGQGQFVRVYFFFFPSFYEAERRGPAKGF
jgi:hypothetical protein